MRALPEASKGMTKESSHGCSPESSVEPAHETVDSPTHYETKDGQEESVDVLRSYILFATHFGLRKRKRQHRRRSTTGPYPKRLCHTVSERAIDEEMSANGKFWRTYTDETLICDAEIAGLFSAVLTTFVIQTSQNPRPDYTEVSASLLIELVGFQWAANISSAPSSPFYPSISFSTSPADVWLNSLKFSSNGVINISVISDILPRDPGSIRQYRCMGLKTWQVPMIIGSFRCFSTSPWVLFFAGLSIYLFTLHISIAHAVAAISAAAYVAFVACLVLPLIYRNCPYKTPLMLHLPGLYHVHSIVNLSLPRHHSDSLSRANPFQDTTASLLVVIRSPMLENIVLPQNAWVSILKCADWGSPSAIRLVVELVEIWKDILLREGISVAGGISGNLRTALATIGDDSSDGLSYHIFIPDSPDHITAGPPILNKNTGNLNSAYWKMFIAEGGMPALYHWFANAHYLNFPRRVPAHFASQIANGMVDIDTFSPLRLAGSSTTLSFVDSFSKLMRLLHIVDWHTIARLLERLYRTDIPGSTWEEYFTQLCQWTADNDFRPIIIIITRVRLCLGEDFNALQRDGRVMSNVVPFLQQAFSDPTGKKMAVPFMLLDPRRN
ncbi:hypothetical protein DFS33DRAFT_1277070 [Desarmillaria ectypa]|nr:hypothetical protein DFS33DRAFT_1277070 [Desarmillaria ectypa]